MNNFQLGPEENEGALSRWQFIDNRGHSVAGWLRSHLALATSAKICVAYFTPTGLDVIKDELEDFLSKSGSLSIITSEEIGKADARVLLQLAEKYPIVQARVYPAEVAFMHSKVYLLEDGEQTHLLVGSSNLTIGGLQTNIESNLAGSFPSDHQMVLHWQGSFEAIWGQGVVLEKAIDRLRERATREGGLSMEVPKHSAGHPIPVGSIVVVHGQRGRVLDTENIGGNRFRYEILLEASGQAQKWVVPPTEIRPWLGPLDVALSKEFSSPLEYDLRTEALRLSLAYEYDRLVSLSSSRVNLEPYQVEAVHRVVNSFPHRFLIADDTGLGKTIETGMILEELVVRGRAERVLVMSRARVV